MTLPNVTVTSIGPFQTPSSMGSLMRSQCGLRRSKQAIADTKRLVDVASLPPNAEIKPEWDAFIAPLGRPASQKRIKALMERGFHRAGDVENRLGFHVGQLGG